MRPRRLTTRRSWTPSRPSSTRASHSATSRRMRVRTKLVRTKRVRTKRVRTKRVRTKRVRTKRVSTATSNRAARPGRVPARRSAASTERWCRDRHPPRRTRPLPTRSPARSGTQGRSGRLPAAQRTQGFGGGRRTAARPSTQSVRAATWTFPAASATADDRPAAHGSRRRAPARCARARSHHRRAARTRRPASGNPGSPSRAVARRSPGRRRALRSPSCAAGPGFSTFQMPADPQQISGSAISRTSSPGMSPNSLRGCSRTPWA